MLTYADVCYVIQVSAISSFLRDKFADVFGEAVMRQKKKKHHSLLIMHQFRY
jgi:hypothetical protein